MNYRVGLIYGKSLATRIAGIFDENDLCGQVG